MSVFNSSFESIVQTGLMPKVVDTVLKESVLTARILGNAQKWKGKQLVKSFKYKKQTNGSSFAGLEVFDSNKTDNKRQLSFDPKGYRIPVVIDGIEKSTWATDPTAAVDLTVEAIENATNDGADDIAAIFYGDGTGNSSKDPLGLLAIIDDGSVVSTYGGQSRSTYTTLKAYRTSPAAGLTSMSILATAENSVRYGSERVGFHVTSDTKWTEYENLLLPTLHSNVDSEGYSQMTRNKIVSPKDAAGASGGFNALFFRGKPVVADQKCPDLKWFGINEKNIAWFGIKAAVNGYTPIQIGGNKEQEGVYEDMPSQNLGFAFSGLKTSPNQFGEIGYIVLLGNLVSFNPSRHFQINFAS